MEEGFGLTVDNVLPDSPAQAAGIQRYDILKLLNDQQLMSPDQLSRLVNRLGKDADATLTIIRKGQEQKLTIKVGEKLLPSRGEGEGMRYPGFGGMGGIERPMDREQLDELRRRMQEMGGRGGSGGGEGMRGMPDRMREMQERMRAYQESMHRYQEQLREWQKNPGSEMPKMPQMPDLPGEPGNPERPGRPGQGGQPGVRPADILRELRPGDRPGMRAEWSEGSSRWDASQARLKMRDADGELEIVMQDGKRVLTFKNPEGEVAFTGPVDSPAERAAIPEPIRKKLAAMAPPPLSGAEPNRPRPPSLLVRPSDREPDVQ